MLSQNNQIDLLRIEFECRVSARDNLFSVLLFYVLSDREDADIGKDWLRRHDFNASSLGGVVVARETDDVDSIVGENESAGRGIAAVVDLDRHCALSARQDGRHEAADPGLDELVMPDRLAADESDTSHRTSHILKGVRLCRLCDHKFGDRRLWPNLPARRPFVDHRSHWQILSGHKHLLKVDLRRSLGG